MNNKTKNILLVGGFILLLIVSYKFSISKTIHYRKQYNDKKLEQIAYKEVPKKIAILKQKEKYFDSILKSNNLKYSSYQNNLLKTISTIADSTNLKVVSFKEPHMFLQNDLIVKTYAFSVEGNFNSILNLVYQLEFAGNFGEVLNLHLQKKKNFRTNREYLETKILLKSFN